MGSIFLNDVEKLIKKNAEDLLKYLFGNTKSKQICPFHADKNPSMKLYVNEYSARFYCFGCQRTYSFAQVYAKMKYNDISEDKIEQAYNDILKLLGYNATIVLDDASKVTHAYKQCIRDFIVNALTYNLSVKARNFLASKYIDAHDVPYKYKLFELKQGINVDELMLSLATKYKLDVEELRKIFMPIRYNRLIYALPDENGDVIAFASRDLTGESGPKYLNSGSYVLYSKTKYVYGIHLAHAQPKVSGAKHLYLVEGYNDAIAMYENGFTNTIALGGVSLSEYMLRRLIEYGYKHMVLLLDGDKAGDEAAIRLITDVFAKHGISSEVLSLPVGMDVDDFLKVRGVEELSKLKRTQDVEIILKQFKTDVKQIIELLSNFDLDVLESKTKSIGLQSQTRFELLYSVAKRKYNKTIEQTKSQLEQFAQVLGINIGGVTDAEE